MNVHESVVPFERKLGWCFYLPFGRFYSLVKKKLNFVKFSHYTHITYASRGVYNPPPAVRWIVCLILLYYQHNHKTTSILICQSRLACSTPGVGIIVISFFSFRWSVRFSIRTGLLSFYIILRFTCPNTTGAVGRRRYWHSEPSETTSGLFKLT